MRFEQKHKHVKIVIETDEVTLPEIIQTFSDFLKGCGFVFDGRLDFVYDEEE